MCEIWRRLGRPACCRGHNARLRRAPQLALQSSRSFSMPIAFPSPSLTKTFPAPLESQENHYGPVFGCICSQNACSGVQCFDQCCHPPKRRHRPSADRTAPTDLRFSGKTQPMVDRITLRGSHSRHLHGKWMSWRGRAVGGSRASLVPDPLHVSCGGTTSSTGRTLLSILSSGNYFGK